MYIRNTYIYIPLIWLEGGEPNKFSQLPWLGMVGIQGMILLWTLTACNQHCSWPLSRMINILCFVSSKKIGIRVLHSSPPFHGQTITILMASNKRFPYSHGISITTGFPMVFPWVSPVFHPPKPDFRDLNEEAKELKSFCSARWYDGVWTYGTGNMILRSYQYMGYGTYIYIYGIWMAFLLVGYFYTVWCFGTWLLWLPIYWKCHHPNCYSLIFFRGVGQPPTSYVMGYNGI